MKARKSIAWRIMLVLTGLVSLGICLAALMTYLVYTHMQDSMIRELVQTESKRLVLRVSRFGGTWTQPLERDMGPSMYAWGESAAVAAPTLPDELRRLPPGLHELDRGESSWHVAVADAMDGRLYVLFDSVVVEQQKRHFSHALLGIVVGCSLLAMLISSAVARWLTTPLHDLAQRLARWVPSPRLGEVTHANEADRLMEVFNRVQDQVDAAIADQREFSANLHHEIRTPLTIIQSDAEIMLLDLEMPPQSRRARLKRIVKSTHEINQSLESTFCLAHAHFEDKAWINLRQCVEDIADSLNLEAAKAGLVLRNAVPPTQQALLNQHALRTVMRNIMRNAILHAAPTTLVVESIANGLQFTDDGPGIAAAELPHVFSRYFSHRRADQRLRNHAEPRPGAHVNQTGLGLAIAQRVCLMLSWRLEAISPVAHGKGTRFTLVFPEKNACAAGQA